MIVDAHLHIWQVTSHFPDPGATIVSPLSEVPFTLLLEYMEEHTVDKAVLVQPIYPWEDNSYVADCAARDPDRFAAVCVVDPRQPDADNQLAYWVPERGCKGLRLRPRLPEEAAVFGDLATYPLWERARDLNIVVSLLANTEHLPTVALLAERFPEVAIVIDHMAHPDVTAGVQSGQFQELLGWHAFRGYSSKSAVTTIIHRSGIHTATVGISSGHCMIAMALRA